MCGTAWIDTAQDRERRLGEEAGPDLLLEPIGGDLGGGDPASDSRADWLTRLSEVFPPGAAGEPVEDWAGVSRRTGALTAGECRVETAPSRERALARLAAGPANGWVPVILVDLRSGEGWRARLTCHADRLLRW